jgi:hypothetical protein
MSCEGESSVGLLAGVRRCRGGGGDRWLRLRLLDLGERAWLPLVWLFLLFFLRTLLDFFRCLLLLLAARDASVTASD